MCLKKKPTISSHQLSFKFRSLWEPQFVLGRQCLGEQFLNDALVAILRHRQFADQQIARPFQHLLLAERQRLGLVQHQQALQHASDFEQRAGAHALGVFLEAVLPISIVQALAIRKKIKDFLDFPVAHHPPQANAIDVVEGNHDLQTAGLDLKQVKLLDGGADRPTADLLDHAYTVVGVHNFIADVETVATNHEETPVSAPEQL